jgi:hypothetical protein
MMRLPRTSRLVWQQGHRIIARDCGTYTAKAAAEDRCPDGSRRTRTRLQVVPVVVDWQVAWPPIQTGILEAVLPLAVPVIGNEPEQHEPGNWDGQETGAYRILDCCGPAEARLDIAPQGSA